MQKKSEPPAGQRFSDSRPLVRLWLRDPAPPRSRVAARHRLGVSGDKGCRAERPGAPPGSDIRLLVRSFWNSNCLVPACLPSPSPLSSEDRPQRRVRPGLRRGCQDGDPLGRSQGRGPGKPAGHQGRAPGGGRRASASWASAAGDERGATRPHGRLGRGPPGN